MSLERLGDTDAFASELLRLMQLGGWDVQDPTIAFAGGVLLTAATPQGYEIAESGDTLAEAAHKLWNNAAHYPGIRVKEPVQLRLA